MRTPRLVFVADRHSRLTAIDVATGTSVRQLEYTAGPDAAAEIWSTLEKKARLPCPGRVRVVK